MRSTPILASFVAAVALALGVVGGSGAATDDRPLEDARVAWVAAEGTAAEARARTAVAAAEAGGAEAEARFPRTRFEHDVAVRYLEARGFDLRLLGAAPR